MREPELRRIVSQLGITLGERTHRGWLHARCPLAPWTHPRGHDRRPSFGVRVNREGLSAFSCFTCGHKGRISGLCRALGNFRYGDPYYYEQLARDADAADGGAVMESGWELDREEDVPEPVDETFFEDMFPPAERVPEAREYLRSRGVTSLTSGSLGLLADPEDHRVLFPVRDRRGLLYGFTGRSWVPDGEPKVRDYCFPKRHFVLGEERWRGWRETDPQVTPSLRGSRPLVLVEGLFAYAHLVELQVERVCNVGALLGNTLTQEKANRVLELGAPTYLLLDDDEGGDVGIYGRRQRDGSRQDGAVQLLQRLPLAIPAWPEGKNDPDELTKVEVWTMLRDTPVLTSEEGGFTMSEPFGPP